MMNPPATPTRREAAVTPATPACREQATGPHALPFRAGRQRPGPAIRTRSQLLGPVDTAPRCARGILLEALAAWKLGHLAGLRERSEAICSEIVTNAIAVSVAKAPSGTEPAPVVLTVAVERGHLFIDVWDPDPAPPPCDDGRGDGEEFPDVWSESGRGLFIVGKYASRWGWRPGANGGKTIWAAIALDAPPP